MTNSFLRTRTHYYYEWAEVVGAVNKHLGRNMNDYDGRFSPTNDPSKKYLCYWLKVINAHDLNNESYNFISPRYIAKQNPDDKWLTEIADAFEAILGPEDELGYYFYLEW